MVFVYPSSSTKYVVKKPTFPTNLPTGRVEVESNSWFPPHGSQLQVKHWWVIVHQIFAPKRTVLSVFCN